MLAKTQIQDLNDDQQAALAEGELRLAQKRQKLLQQARGYSLRFRGITVLSLISPLFCLIAFRAGPFLPMVLFAVLFAFIIQIQAICINRRLDDDHLVGQTVAR
jgi:hypothetical protein